MTQMNLAAKNANHPWPSCMTKSKPTIIFLVGGLLAALGLFGYVRQGDETISVAQDCAASQAPTRALPGGSFTMGAHPVYSEEGPPRVVEVEAFDIDATEVTNAQFAGFVAATGYVTDAEKPQLGFNVAGGVVFRPPTLTNPSWWHFVEGANWRHPEGPESTITGRDYEPVVQVSHKDAKAYASWAGRRLPQEAEWEYAANAGADTLYVWGDERAPEGREMANSWQGTFPIQNTAADGYAKRAPVGCYPPNDFGLYDMIGNVWEWTDTAASSSATAPVTTSATTPANGEAVYRIKGGSFLCAPNFCRRYRAAARQSQEAGLPTSHIGFRTVSN